MSVTQFAKLLKNLGRENQRDLIIRIETNSLKKGLQRSKQLMKKMEREMRIQKLELAIKGMNITRSWV